MLLQGSVRVLSSIVPATIISGSSIQVKLHVKLKFLDLVGPLLRKFSVARQIMKQLYFDIVLCLVTMGTKWPYSSKVQCKVSVFNL